MQVARTLHRELASLPQAVRMAFIMTKMDLIDSEVMQGAGIMRYSHHVHQMQEFVATSIGVPRNMVSPRSGRIPTSAQLKANEVSIGRMD